MKLVTTFILSVSLAFAPAVFAQSATTSEKPAVSSSGKPEIPVGRYVTGGVLGSAVGFGIGHGVQGRYAEKGWIFTVADSVAMTLIFAGIGRCMYDSPDNTDTNCSNTARNQIALGYVGLIGFRIWEAVDVWTAVRPAQNEASLFILPATDSTKLGFVYKF